jgi:hypothetical protein
MMSRRVPIIAVRISGQAFEIIVEALVPGACRQTGGWHNRLYTGIGDILVGFLIDGLE